MNAPVLIYTALLLGVFVLCAGAYAVLYALGRLRSGAPRLLLAARLCFALQATAAALVVVLTPLGWDWKLLVAASCLAMLRIPHATWRYLDSIHAHR